MTSGPPRAIVVGLGNPILTDDAIGILVAREVRERCRGVPGIEVREAESAGFDLVELLGGADRAVIVDALETPGARPGTVRRLAADELPGTGRLAGSHGVSLGSALALGRLLGLPMPAALVVVGVEVQDARSFGERPTPAVLQAVAPAAEEAIAAALSR